MCARLSLGNSHPCIVGEMTRVLLTMASLVAMACVWGAATAAAAFVPQSHGRSIISRVMSSKEWIEFSKYQGLGNDFILIDDRDKTSPSLTSEESARLCDRNFGVGGDGVIFALQSPVEECDVGMRIYNSDGSEPEMCGNGIRCLAQFLQERGETAASCRVHTLAGPMVPRRNDDGSITVDMGEPVLSAADVPTALPPNAPGDSVVEQDYRCNGKDWKVTAVGMGNPHAVFFLPDLDDPDQLHFASDGPAIETDTTAFPAKTNVEFVQVLSPTHLKMKVWERGAGPTLACGTGTCALVVAAIRANKIPRSDNIKVTLPGGDLFIEWRESDNRIYMTGPADLSFRGKALKK